jgi:hypothetical protein
MRTPSFTELIPILQLAVAPVILVSGVGLLLLTMNNKLGRIIDRSWALTREIRQRPAEEHERILAQMRLLLQRGRTMRQAIALAVICMLLAAVLVLMIFLTALFRLDDAWLLGLIFVGALGSLVGSLLSFFKDTQQTLVALKLELGEWLKEEV